MQFLEKMKPLGLLLLRVAIGISFMYHGYPKIADSHHWVQMMPKMGFPGYFAYIAGILEVFGGGLLIVGLFARGVGLLFAIEMAAALARTILPSAGIYAIGKYELPLLLGTGALAIATTGAGLISIDAFTFESRAKASKKSKRN